VEKESKVPMGTKNNAICFIKGHEGLWYRLVERNVLGGRFGQQQENREVDVFTRASSSSACAAQAGVATGERNTLSRRLASLSSSILVFLLIMAAITASNNAWMPVSSLADTSNRFMSFDKPHSRSSVSSSSSSSTLLLLAFPELRAVSFCSANAVPGE